SHPGLDGGGSVAADSKGNVYVAWHAPAKAGPGVTEQDRRVWVVRSVDEGKTFGPESAASEAADGACGCCGMKVFADDDGRVYGLFRAAAHQTDRGMHLLASSDPKAAEFTDRDISPMKIGACIMSTEAMAPA